MGDNYTKFPNIIFDALLKQPLTDTERRTAFLIIRLTNGWNKPSDQISYGRIAEFLGISRRSAIRAVGNLEKMGIIHVGRDGSINEIQIRMPDKWDKVVTGVSPEVVTHMSPEVVTGVSPKLVTRVSPTKEKKEGRLSAGADYAPKESEEDEDYCDYEALLEEIRRMSL